MPVGYSHGGGLGPHYTATILFAAFSSPWDDADQLVLSDRLLSFDVTWTKDEPASRASFTLSRGVGVDSLAPSVTATTMLVAGRPALQPGHWVRLYADIGGNVRPFWGGRIDRMNATGTFGPDKQRSVTITCRDFGALFLNGVIRYPYNINDTNPILERFQNIANEAYVQGSLQGGNSGALDPVSSIIEPVGTGWVTNPLLPQDSMNVMEAFRRSVQTFGGDIRVQPIYGLSKLVIAAPPRPDTPIYDIYTGRLLSSGLTPTAVFSKEDYLDIQEVQWGDEDVRNQWEGWFRDVDTGLPVGPTYVEDALSISLYGPRYARVFLDRAEGITTTDQMLAFLTAAKNDNRDPLISHRIIMPFFPDVTLDDIHLYLSNNDEYDYNLESVVSAITHHWETTPGVMATTTIGGRQTAIGAYREYRRSLPKRAFATTIVPTTEFSEEGTVIMVTDDLSP